MILQESLLRVLVCEQEGLEVQYVHLVLYRCITIQEHNQII